MADEFTDLNGRAVHAFSVEMANLGFTRMQDRLLAMLESGAWQHFKDGMGEYTFLPGEFDYFLSQWGVPRADVVNGVKDIRIKARLDEAMDERKTGEAGYRRPLVQARAENPKRPGGEITPFGVTEAELRTIGGIPVSGGNRRRVALGRAVRQWRRTGGATTRHPNDQLPRAERLRRSAVRLSDQDLAQLVAALKEEQERRGTPQLRVVQRRAR